ncbi:MAG: hydantoinase [Geminicoccaceae bacterium]|nr:MAG: hydantoinase [Geminicoccaceae bacterium]
MSGGWTVGVDVGGTFTDFVFLDERSGRVETAKVPSTRGREAVGFLEGLDAAAGRSRSIAAIVHGTTVGTNAVLERKVAPTGVLTTRGFRDVLEMRRRDRPWTWGLWGTFTPIVPRDRRLEVGERTLASGEIREPIAPEEVAAAARRLLELGCRAVAIVFVNAYANPTNERRAAEIVRALWPEPAFVTASHEILPEIREFERTSTTVLNACLQPVVGSYLEVLERELGRRGVRAPLSIVQSNGGLASAADARLRPVHTILSGPAAGVVAAVRIAEAAGFRDLVTCDMGGTSFDVALVRDGAPTLAAQTALDFGLVVRAPMIEIATIGAGGGSIARVDAGGILQVGPESAGAVPGPACYAAGGDRPTVTDANLLLGRIDPDRPIGGKLRRLDVEAAREAIGRWVGRPLGLDPLDAAEAILAVANARMAGAIRLVSIERGHDPKRLVAVPYGGGGALHVGALVREVGLEAALVPRFPGVTSALGCVLADWRYDQVRTLDRPLTQLDLDAFDAAVVELVEQGREWLARARASLERTRFVLEADMLYQGQTHTVAVPLSSELELVNGRTGLDRDRLHAAFEAAYRAAFGRPLAGVPVRLLNLRLASIGERPRLDPAILAPGPDASIERAARGGRPVRFDGRWLETRVFDRLALPVGATIPGPAVLEQPDATVLVEPGMVATVDRFGNLLIRRGGDA